MKMIFDLSIADAWLILPRWAQVLPLAYFVCIICLQFAMNLLVTVFAGVASKATSNTRTVFWILTGIFWLIYFITVALIVIRRSSKVNADSFDEFVTQYFTIRPLSSVEVRERRRRWKLLADVMNNYIQTELETYDSRVMKRFHLTDKGVEKLVKKYIKQYNNDKRSYKNLPANLKVCYEL